MIGLLWIMILFVVVFGGWGLIAWIPIENWIEKRSDEEKTMKKLSEKWNNSSPVFKMFASSFAVLVLSLGLISLLRLLVIESLMTPLMFVFVLILTPIIIVVAAIRHGIPIRVVRRIPPPDSPFWSEVNNHMGGRPPV